MIKSFNFNYDKLKICIIGLGYVGLPLAVSLSKKFNVIGYDKSSERINELNNGIDRTGECDLKAQGAQITFTCNSEDIRSCNFYIIAVPTPIDNTKKPDLSAMLDASATVGSCLKLGDYVVYESTVYPGAVREECVPILESFSSLISGVDFDFGYSPERINPGDKQRPLEAIVKLVSAGRQEALPVISSVYASVIEAGVYECSSVEVAEAAKVIENTQRDLNIALVNEFSKIFNIMNIDTTEIIAAASTKWNFHSYFPGLVGGHCIGVDPYYLTHKASQLGYQPEVILSGRKLNDEMHEYIASKFIKKILRNISDFKSRKVLILGCTFKENCPDVRNSRVFPLIDALIDYGLKVEIYDPYVSNITGYSFVEIEEAFVPDNYLGVILAVKHAEFRELSGSGIRECLTEGGVIFDLHSILDKSETDFRL